ncbi:enoyl-CoA hydratase/isomerase family protein [Rhodospirillum rubrum]|uniref:enoyl-CoA hydratase/isomerase family protein n=1 Tax=Rhodospirillum rubrum TaxID=1085 RepID=UPI000037ABC8|nr:enoyl-CoA hydratase-related protein [Rhodospirillum rubrum]AEO49039.1 enoyl-CoA hydratase / short chain enoyl-CoA hydratase [Rhodospirillum rubrum F11]QXG79280.1 enoyl-CoA hydratase/isomerase family protein [Rhodospirillum rubrum]
MTASQSGPVGAAPSASVLVTIEGAVATLVLNRPDRLNALDLPLWRALGEAVAVLAGRLAEGEDLRCLVLRGAGGRAFAAGADIGEFATLRATAAQAQDYDRVMRRALDGVRAFPVPVIAAIEGACVGAGLELACMADLRLSNASGRFGVPINRIGVVMAYPEIGGLLRLAGPANTLEILLEGRVFGADEALRMGLVNRVVADGAFAAHLDETVSRLVRAAPGVNASHKAFVTRLLAEGPPPGEAEMAECYRFLETEDYREGVAAFLAKRPPVFKGR